MASDVRNIIERFLTRYYKGGGLERTSDGWLIRCPWHSPDKHPSCNIYANTGIFYCWRCKTKTPKEGFLAIGVPENEVNEHFGRNRNRIPDEPQKLPSLDDIEAEEVDTETAVFEVVRDDPWPEGWAFRDLSAAAFQKGHPIFDLVKPRLVKLGRMGQNGKRKMEGLPRLALSFPANPELQLYLRLSSLVDHKVVNGFGVGSKFDANTIPFGLREWKLPETCKALVLVEGPYDLLRLKHHLWELQLYDRVEVVALLGTHQWRSFFAKFKLHLAQQIMKKDRLLVLAFDGDEPGAEVTVTALQDLSATNFLFPDSKVKVLNYFTHDPGELDLEGTKEAFKEIGIK
jgi:hypothetical protein